MSLRDPDALRAEHDALATRLAVRHSIDDVRKGAYGLLASLIGTGLAVKLAYDRWWSVRPNRIQGRPLYFYAMSVVAGIAILCTVRWFLRARRLMAAEQADFARLQALRADLGLDP